MRSHVSSYQSHPSAIISVPTIGTEPIDSAMDTIAVGADDSILQDFQLSVTRSQLGSSSVWLRLTTNFQNITGNTYRNNVLGVRDVKIVVEDHQLHEVVDTNIQIDSTRYAVSGDYRFGFQGQERNDEIKGSGNSLNYKYRMHDPRLGRFFSIDPLAKEFAWNSPYAFSENRVIDGIEFEGLEVVTLNGGGRVGASSPSAPGISLSAQGQFVMDLDENRVGFQLTGGGGLFYGVGGEFSAGIGYHHADNPSQLLGSGLEIGSMLGVVTAADVSYDQAHNISKEDLEILSHGGEVNVGVGAGVGAYAEEQYTVGVEGDYIDLGLVGAVMQGSFLAVPILVAKNLPDEYKSEAKDAVKALGNQVESLYDAGKSYFNDFFEDAPNASENNNE